MPYRLLLTLFFLLFAFFGEAQENSPVIIKTVVIDAGHGGNDPGAISPNGRLYEKSITLSVALKLGAMIKKKYPDIDVIYTRTTDVFIPLEKRTEIANKNQASLFISIHVNSARARSASGSETFVMGADKSSSNLEVTMLENSVIALEGDHESKYGGFDPNNPESYIIFSLLQNAHLEQSLNIASLIQDQFSTGPIKINRGIKQGGLLVLWKTTMPAVLVELGFISNSLDYWVLASPNSHSLFAGSIFKAFEQFKFQYDAENKSATPSVDIVINPDMLAQNQNNSKETDLFSIQILAVSSILPHNARDLKGEQNTKYYKVDKFYKYCVGEFITMDEATKELSRIKLKFPQAFIIKVEKGTIVRIK